MSAWTPHPHRGRRVGEAAYLEPPSDGDLELRRQRALHGCSYCHLAPARPRCATTKRTGMPLKRCRTRSVPPPLSPLLRELPLSNYRELWQLWPQQHPTKRHQASHHHPHRTSQHGSLLLAKGPCPPALPLLPAGAGNLSARAQHDWRSRPGFGPRFWELASLLRDAQYRFAWPPMATSRRQCKQRCWNLLQVRQRLRQQGVWRTIPGASTNHPPQPPPGAVAAAAAAAAAPQQVRNHRRTCPRLPSRCRRPRCRRPRRRCECDIMAGLGHSGLSPRASTPGAYVA